jgi:guanylate kinase
MSLIATSHPADRRPIIISGPSGVGKGTLYKLLQEAHPDVYAPSISHTTRDPRPGEVRDQDYYYVTMQDFERLIDEGGFVEHAKFGGNRYGTSRKMIEEFTKGGKVVILDIEMEVCWPFFPSVLVFCSSRRDV